jgi:hypothetical protein
VPRSSRWGAIVNARGTVIVENDQSCFADAQEAVGNRKK